MKRYLPHLVVLVTSMCVMIVELLASRIVAKHFGNSLYTWTTVIGVVLGGISLGNFIGGRIADRFEPRTSVTVQLVASAFLVLAIVPLDAILFEFVRAGSATITTDALIRSILVICAFFLLPATAIGTISPVMAKYAIVLSSKIGRTVGGIYAVSAIGSIAGTFLAGYLLIPTFGVRVILFGVAGVIGVLAIITGGMRFAAIPGSAIAIVALLVPGQGYSSVYYERQGSAVLYETDTAYSHVLVRELEQAGRTERQLIMDGLIHNRFDAESPGTLLYDYEQIFDGLVRSIDGDRTDLRTLTIGGGAAVHPSLLAKQFPDGNHIVAEIDPEVIEVAKRYFGLSESETLSVIATDGRRYVNSLADDIEFDYVFLDAFDSYSIPTHLTTEEFLRELKEVIAADGFLIVNCIDIVDLGGFASSYLKTLRTVFPFTAIYHDDGFETGNRSTLVFLAGRRNPYINEVADEEGRTVGVRMDETLYGSLVRADEAITLTDDFAPVEQFMAPVFLHNVK